ncbi:hypothetical protein L596_001676 [Steinernema carpocapsae]|uniref:Odorant receptor n=1 Tax=Steinernema carpocapsae TaxID=34508 RepID=A0A4U8UPK5_STECR|nr:hypothetical protein L596_001676 [Steinernema carpocapsae]
MLREYVRLLQIPQKYRGCNKGEKLLRRSLSVMFAIMGGVSVFHLMFFFVILFHVKFPFVYGRLDMLKKFYYEIFACVPALLALYLNFLWIIALFTYILFNMAAYLEFKEFNHNLKKLGKSVDEKGIASRLVELIDIHRGLAHSVRKLDKIFEAYAFVMIASNIPATIFSILLIASSHNLSLTHFLLALPSIAFCIIELVGLTAAPAMLHGAICRSNSLLFSNHRIWSPYRPEVYQIAQSLLCHLNQTNLGVSIWGFAVVTKPLILTKG